MAARHVRLFGSVGARRAAARAHLLDRPDLLARGLRLRAPPARVPGACDSMLFDTRSYRVSAKTLISFRINLENYYISGDV